MPPPPGSPRGSQLLLTPVTGGRVCRAGAGTSTAKRPPEPWEFIAGFLA